MMKKRVLNKYKCTKQEIENGILIMRGTPFGNPFVIGKDGTREEVVEKYRSYLTNKIIMDDEFLFQFKELYNSGKDLICCCSPLPCHGDIILDVMKLLDGLDQYEE